MTGAVPVDFGEWLSRPRKQIQFLVRIDAKTTAGAAAPLRFSTHGHVGSWDDPDTAERNQPWIECVDEGISFDRSVWSGDRIGPEVRADYGYLTLLDHRRSLDALRALVLEGMPVKVHLGGTKDDGFRDLADFRMVHSGTIRRVEDGHRTVTLYLDDGAAAFDEPLHAARYAGTGGNEGGEDLKGKLKPCCLGYCLNVPLVLVNPSNLTYQYHFRPAQQVVAVYSRGAAIDPANYVVDLGQGLLALTAAFDAPITADIRGDAGPAGGQYVSDPASLARRAIKLGGIPDAEVDEASFTALAAVRTGEAGVFFPGAGEDTATVRDALNAILGGHLDWWGRRRSGLVRVGAFSAPSGTPALALDTDLQAFEPQPEAAPPPAWRVRVGVGRNHAVMSGQDLAGSVQGTARETFLREEWRFVTAEDAAVKALYPYARELDLRSSFISEAEGQREANRLLALLETRMRLYRVAAGVAPLSVELMDTISLRADRHGLDAGASFRALHLEEVGARRLGAARVSQTTVTLWAPA